MSIIEYLVNISRRRSPWLFHVDSGGCNGCDLEVIACFSPRYDAEQLGVKHEASPRHADIIVVTGPVTRTAAEAVQRTYAQVPDPKVVVAVGSCPATCNAYAGSPVVVGPLERIIPVDVYVPGRPPRPDAILEGIVQAAAILSGATPRPIAEERVPAPAPEDAAPAAAEDAPEDVAATPETEAAEVVSP